MNSLFKVSGLWTEGFVFDKYIRQSIYTGDDVFGNPQFNTTYTEIGKLLHDIKYNGHIDTSSDIALQCNDFLQEWLQKINVDIIIPVPPTIRREVQPIFSITEAIAEKLNVPFTEKVLFKAEGLPSKNMDKTSKNIEGTIVQLKPAKRNCNILLVDDLYSTGATANECVTVLKRDPLIKNIYFFAIAKTKE